MKQELKSYVNELQEAAGKSDFDALGKIASLIMDTKKSGARIYSAGNGGSASTASHIANDLVKGCRVGGNPGFEAFSLSDTVPVITCLANDFSYEEVYSIQLETYGRPGDLLLVFSGSGNSENIVRAVETAKKMGMVTIGFLGRDGGRLKALCDVFIIAPTDSMEQIEDIHLSYEHAIVNTLSRMLPLQSAQGMQGGGAK